MHDFLHEPMNAVVFDLDGTLLDTLDDLWYATNHALASYGLPERTRDEVRRFVGNGYGRLTTLAAPAGTNEEVLSELLATFNAYYQAHATDHTGPYPHIHEMLDALRARGVPMAVVSNKGDAAVKELVEAHFPGVFACAVGERPGIRRKPAPDTVLAVCEELGVAATDIVYVGDSEVDIATAQAVGCACVSVCWGFRTVEELQAAGATCFVRDPREIAG